MLRFAPDKDCGLGSASQKQRDQLKKSLEKGISSKTNSSNRKTKTSYKWGSQKKVDKARGIVKLGYQVRSLCIVTRSHVATTLTCVWAGVCSQAWMGYMRSTTYHTTQIHLKLALARSLLWQVHFKLKPKHAGVLFEEMDYVMSQLELVKVTKADKVAIRAWGKTRYSDFGKKTWSDRVRASLVSYKKRYAKKGIKMAVKAIPLPGVPLSEAVEMAALLVRRCAELHMLARGCFCLSRACRVLQSAWIGGCCFRSRACRVFQCHFLG